MAFHVGQKVVCVNDGLSRFSGKPTNLKKGAVYTIKAAFEFAGTACVLLAEIDPPSGHGNYDAMRFRPVIERKTDISIFTDMLKPKSVKEDA